MTNSWYHKPNVRSFCTQQISSPVDATVKNSEIDEIINSWGKNPFHPDIGPFIDERLKECNLRNVCHMMRLLGKRPGILKSTSFKEKLPAFVSQLQYLDKKKFTFPRLSSIAYGLQCIDERVDDHVKILSIITKKMILASNERTATSKEVCNMLMGLQRNRASREETKLYLRVLAPVIEKSEDEFTPQAVSNSLLGLRSMNSNTVEVLNLLKALERKVLNCKQELSAQDLGSAFSGLRNMNGNNPGVRSMLSALIPKVINMKGELDSQSVGYIMHGLHWMSSDHAVVLELITALEPKIQKCEILGGKALSQTVYGLRSMRSDSPVVLSLVSVIEATILS